MKGIIWNGDATITKGTGSSQGRGMFSVGNLVAFATSSYCSPDGRQSWRHIEGSYLLQEEIELKEWDNSTYPGPGRGPVGGMDHQQVIELQDIFWYRSYDSISEKTFLLQILETQENVFSNGFISGNITEVRNYANKFLHFYEIPKDYRGCKGDTFEATVEAINMQKKLKNDSAEKAVIQNYREVELDFGITTRGGWYKPSSTFGTYEIGQAHEYDDSRTKLGRIKIMPCVLEGGHQFYIWGYPVSLYLKKGQKPSISVCASSSWCNSQSWWYDELDSTTIQKGWIFVDGEDVFEKTIEAVNKNHQGKVAARKNKFEELSKAVVEKHGEEVLKLALGKKGSVLAILKALNESKVQVKSEDFRKIFSLSNSATIIANLMVCVAGRIDPQKAAKLSQKAFAWRYLGDSLPEVSFAGYFDDAVAALKIYSVKWEKNVAEEFIPATNILGDFLKKS